MKKMRLIDLLLMVADKKLKDGQMVLIDNNRGGITPRLNTDGTLKLNETCLKNKE